VKYKGYTAVLKADEEQGILFGRVIGLRDVITFQAETVSQAIKEFHISVDTYLELCRSRQQSPEKPYSGNFMVRVNPELHRQIAILAQEKSVSINSLVARMVRHACTRRCGTGDVVRAVTQEEMKSRKLSQPQSPKKRKAKVVHQKRKSRAQ
jgi:predicted HicB family RNase H-like nuclease